MVTAVAAAASSHHRARLVDQARHAAASATALESWIRFGFHRNVDSSIAAIDTAIRRPAAKPASRPPIERASHHVTPTAAIPARAMNATTLSGESPPLGRADGASR
jgi:hypothetical protein